MNYSNSIITWVRRTAADMSYANRRLFELEPGPEGARRRVRPIHRQL